MSIFEAGMLLSFGAAWPVSIYKSYKSRSTGGKSWVFSAVVIIGYISGIIHKLLHSRDAVMFLYMLNCIMVTIDLCLWLRNRRIEKAAEQAQE